MLVGASAEILDKSMFAASVSIPEDDEIERLWHYYHI